MATAKPAAPVPLPRAAAYPRILPLRLPRRQRAGITRASPPPATCSGDAGGELPARLQPNARRPLWHGGGFSLGVDLGAARTGIAVGRGITQPRPLTWIPSGSEATGAEAGADAARCSSAAGGGRADHRPAGLGRRERDAAVQQSAERRRKARRPSGRQRRGLRVYLQDEHGTSVDALHYMISRGVKRSSRDDKSDAYAAMMILDRYFSSSGQGAQIVLPRQQELQDKLIAKPRQDAEI
uniref:Holliday junction resolvase n=1 Tax=Triticum urartu TaxID=4572 RepID=A0A8R7K018_TRIUA